MRIELWMSCRHSRGSDTHHCAEIGPGMVLARDPMGPRGTLLLAAGFVFGPRVLRRIREFAQRAG